ncbi:FAS1 domain-containing protein [Xylariomycetidae sp. FL2044]|nr:FAS1 domain-containing protein [Xylariomycetidae sp. FL2044]
MRYATILPFVATAAAVVIPDEATANQLVIDVEHQAEDPVSSWWDSLPSFEDLRSSAEETLGSTLDAFERQANKFADLFPTIEIESEITDFLGPDHLISAAESGNGHVVGKPGHHGTTNLTVYQAIKASNYTKRFAAIVDEHEDVVKLLNSTSANVTAFVPVDKAFEKIPDHHKGKKPPKEFIEKLLKYHIVPGYWPAGRVLAHHTLPTALKAPELGGKPQRLRVRLGLFGVKINFYSKVIVINLFAKNGVAHGVDSLLIPPPPAARLISLFPSYFSTLELAAEKTGLSHHGHHGHHEDDDDASIMHHGNTTGLTIFAPTNWAFQKLGPAANAFLFNTEKGLGFLRALLKYHIVVNETLYSDAYYGHSSPKEDEVEQLLEADDDDETMMTTATTGGGRHYAIDLPTLLDDRSLRVDIFKWHGLVTLKVNGRVYVATQDGVAKDGVIQVVNSVLIPPKSPRKEGEGGDEVQEEEEEEDGEIGVEELMERLAPYVEGEEAEVKMEVGEL